MADTYVGVQTQEGSVEALAELLAGLVGTAASLRLFQAGFSPSRSSVEADFEAVECDFNTYAPAAIVWSAVGIDTAGNAFVQSQNAFFQNVSGANPNTVGGAWIHLDDAGPPVVDAALVSYTFQVPQPMTTPLAAMGLKAVLTLPGMDGYCIVER